MQLPTSCAPALTSVALSLLAIALGIGNTWLSMRPTQPSGLSDERLYCKAPPDHQIPDLTHLSPAYLGTDFPEFYIPEHGPLATVAMAMEKSRHYAIAGPDALDEWASNSPVGYGYIRRGIPRVLCGDVPRAALPARHPSRSRPFEQDAHHRAHAALSELSAIRN
ncbi:hypothetical protein GGX14DRAFT_4127 [Mycena pura]|uniref:Uncharacterized protein n=1 Tax=Mycena pura TaxID=153505 RepID=A0AAD6YV70_9AGAR|nr:hypothetical protein GGX14DRAFT_4127 [Mycena pura]